MTYLSAEDHPEIIDDMARAIVGGFAPKALILFGSQARGDADEFSDVDFVAVVDSGQPSDDVQRDILRALSRFPLDVHVFVRTPEEYLRQSRIPGAMVYPAEREGKFLHEWPGWRERSAVDTDAERDRQVVLRNEYCTSALDYLEEAEKRLGSESWLACRDRCRYAVVKALQGLHVRAGTHPPRDIDVAFQFRAARTLTPEVADWRETAMDLHLAVPESLESAAGLLKRTTAMVQAIIELYALEG
ncbi:nucleotidyltransferase domain-containing protein [Desulfovibrio ferrophilus]|uniref:Predicted nucleotidyltransferase n=1 Tax=Desulfovibrio ferrophilus TaxID=241368 RepID=A0A2Z6AV62_9BACT|nr:nucleotidyltransferase domain-containing protein [Desulfovibrio ferrophilus]BBD07085.1 predicted nucleotidyltransferase [Desulfovibrio ferrophilus]